MSASLDELLAAMNAGRPGAAEQLFEIVYAELRRIASAHRLRERPNPTLQTSDLVHEAYFKLVRPGATWQNRAHFYGAAARAMRQILVDRARKRRLQSDVASGEVHDKADTSDACAGPRIDWLELEELLQQLERDAPRQAQVIMLRFFAGLDHCTIAELVGVNEKTVQRDWRAARAWLHAALNDDWSVRHEDPGSEHAA